MGTPLGGAALVEPRVIDLALEAAEAVDAVYGDGRVPLVCCKACSSPMFPCCPRLRVARVAGTAGQAEALVCLSTSEARARDAERTVERGKPVVPVVRRGGGGMLGRG